MNKTEYEGQTNKIISNNNWQRKENDLAIIVTLIKIHTWVAKPLRRLDCFWKDNCVTYPMMGWSNFTYMDKTQSSSSQSDKTQRPIPQFVWKLYITVCIYELREDL